MELWRAISTASKYIFIQSYRARLGREDVGRGHVLAGGLARAAMGRTLRRRKVRGFSGAFLDPQTDTQMLRDVKKGVHSFDILRGSFHSSFKTFHR